MEQRAARADDYDAVTRFMQQLAPDQPPPPRERWVEHLCPQTLFIADAGELVGYSLSFAFGARGDVRQIVVDSAARRRGIGKVLMAAVAAKLRAAGCTEWRLEVLADNAPAIALYRSVGMRPHATIEILEMAIAVCEQFAATRSGRHTTARVTADDDAALEANLDLGAGQLARWRRYRAHCPMVRVGTTALTQVWPDLTATRGVLFPFLAPDADVAAHLMTEVLRGPIVYEICVRDRDVSAALIAAGATLREQQLEFAGTLG
jgi:ribosomal protein S18 acetylase RimI-like enzyme